MESCNYAIGIKIEGPETACSCAICGSPTGASDEPQIFILETWQVICKECSREHAPSLVKSD